MSGFFKLDDNSAELTAPWINSIFKRRRIIIKPNTGWGRNTWNDGPYGDSNDPIANLTGFGLTASVGDGTKWVSLKEGWGGQFGVQVLATTSLVNDQGVEFLDVPLTAGVGALTRSI